MRNPNELGVLNAADTAFSKVVESDSVSGTLEVKFLDGGMLEGFRSFENV